MVTPLDRIRLIQDNYDSFCYGSSAEYREALPAAPFREAAAVWEGRMEATHFQEGDRVRSRVSRSNVKAGMIGTVRRLFLSFDHTYDVLFDRKHQPVVMRGYELERVEQLQEVGA
jgi:hypothetical protein